MRVRTIISGQRRSVFRDPLTGFLFFIPLLLYFITEYGFDTLQPYVERWIIFSNHRDFIGLLILLISPTLLGMVLGLEYLDEKDMDIYSFIEVTPVNLSGYLWIKSSLGVLVGVTFNSLLTLLLKLPFDIYHTLTILLSSILVPYFSILMLMTSKNRVEGLTKGKLLTFITVGAIVPYYTNSPLKWLLSPLPTFWIEALYSREGILPFFIGFILTLGPIIYLIRRRY